MRMVDMINNKNQWSLCFYVFIFMLISGNQLIASETDQEGKQENVTSAQNKIIDAKFSNIEISTLLRLIAKAGGKSIIIDGEIKNKVSISFEKTPFDVALKSVLQVAQLNMEEHGEVIIIQPREKREVTEGFVVRNIRAPDLITTLKKLFGEQVKIEVDHNTNMVLVTAPVDINHSIKEVVQQLDVPQKQVMIEAAFVEVALEDNTSVGVNLGALLNKFDSTLSIVSRGFAADPDLQPDPVGLFARSDVFVGKTNKSVNAMIEALQTVTDLKVLTHPKVIGANNQEAELIVGKKLGFRVTTTTQTGTQESVEFLKVGTQLRFIPYITENNDVIMTIHPEVSDGSITEDGLPNETTTEITTQVRVANGQTFVLGGLIRERKENVVQQVPLLGSIPFLGALFRRNVDTISRSEILVLITPRIVQDGLTDIATHSDKKRVKRLLSEGLEKEKPKKPNEPEIKSAKSLWFWGEEEF